MLADPVFFEAAGVLEMIAQSPQEREMYEARLKFERDQIWRIKAAKDEGRAEGIAQGIEEGIERGMERGIEQGIERGIERGEYSGQVRLLQRLLGISESPLSELANLDLAQLSSLSIDLQAQLRDRH